MVGDVAEDLRECNDKELDLGVRRIEDGDDNAVFVARLAKGLHAVFSKVQREWCLSRAYIKSSCHQG
jgi:hypothetical protein